jgi:hypothetical protein
MRLVTGYVRLNQPYRRHEHFVDLGRRLLGLHAPTTVFVDGETDLGALPPGVEARTASLDACWLWPSAREARTPAGNPHKDSRAFLAVQHQKSAWLAEAAETSNEALLAWIDFGVLHVPGVTVERVRAFLERAARHAPLDRITWASIHGPPASEDLPWDRVSWHCAGGVVLCPRSQAAWLDAGVREAAAAWLSESGAVTWEVNTWARLWARHPERFHHYLCDHDATLFDAGP